MRWLLVIAIACAVGVAHAAPFESTRVVLVDPDPELWRAMTKALRPWKLEVVVDAEPIDESLATARAEALNARFVVWRSGTDLVVFDRERGDTQHREVTAGELDAVGAASAALSVKTLMRLPPPAQLEHPPATPAAGLEVRMQAGTAARFTSPQTSIRFLGAVMLKPVAAFRLGVVGDLGTKDELQSGSFSGTWSDWSVLAIASWTIAKGKVELEPWIAGGITHARFRASSVMGAMVTELAQADTLLAVRAGGTVRYRFGGLFTLGATVGVEGSPGTPTYTQPKPVDKELYEVPALGVSVGLTVAVDLGR